MENHFYTSPPIHCFALDADKIYLFNHVSSFHCSGFWTRYSRIFTLLPSARTLCKWHENCARGKARRIMHCFNKQSDEVTHRRERLCQISTECEQCFTLSTKEMCVCEQVMWKPKTSHLCNQAYAAFIYAIECIWALLASGHIVSQPLPYVWKVISAGNRIYISMGEGNSFYGVHSWF